MSVELASVESARKPWGCEDLRPWSSVDGSGDAIGELRFHRADLGRPVGRLLLKLLFAREPLSIQVHPGDALARSLGSPNGKTEAWYILSAAAEAQVALGLKRWLTPIQLRQSIRDETIADLVHWIPVAKGDFIFVPAGTIHAIGAGIVLAEIQQHSDTTFRLFDFGRRRQLDEDKAVAASSAGPIQAQAQPRRLTAERTAQIEDPHFVVELIDLPAHSRWLLAPEKETWVLVTEGAAMIGGISVSVGNAVFADAGRDVVDVGADGMRGLMTYTGPRSRLGLLKPCGEASKASDGNPDSLRNSIATTIRTKS